MIWNAFSPNKSAAGAGIYGDIFAPVGFTETIYLKEKNKRLTTERTEIAGPNHSKKLKKADFFVFIP
jgi:hypothetical protein